MSSTFPAALNTLCKYCFANIAKFCAFLTKPQSLFDSSDVSSLGFCFLFTMRKDVAGSSWSDSAAAQSTALRASSVLSHLILTTSLQRGNVLLPLYRGAHEAQRGSTICLSHTLRKGLSWKKESRTFLFRHMDYRCHVV